MKALIHFPKTRLSELVQRFGGLSREEAVAAAVIQLETMRAEADAEVEASIVRLENMADQAASGSEAAMKQMLPLCDQIVTLAGTYNYIALDKATRSLCDLLDGLLSAGKQDRPSIRVHVQTIRMLAPGNSLPPEHVEVMLFELAKLLDHHGFPSLDGDPSVEFTAAL